MIQQLRMLLLELNELHVSWLVGQRRYNDAIQLICRNGPPTADDISANATLALCYNANGDHESAVSHAVRVLRLLPGDEGTLRIVVNYHLQRNAHDEVYRYAIQYLNAPQRDTGTLPNWVLVVIRALGFRRLALTARRQEEEWRKAKRALFDWAVSFRDWYELRHSSDPPMIH